MLIKMLNPKKIRQRILKIAKEKQCSHVGSALSCVEILCGIYKVVNITKNNIKDFQNRDKVVLSKGHGVLALYVILNELGFISDKLLKTYYDKDSKLFGHSPFIPGIGCDCATGALGHGIGMAVGYAYGNKNNKVFCVCGDGETEEGSFWESLRIAKELKVNNLYVIIDNNKWQGLKACNDDRLKDKLKCFIDEMNFLDVREEDFGKVMKMLIQPNIQVYGEYWDDTSLESPFIIMVDTIKGKGWKEYENTLESHYRSVK